MNSQFFKAKPLYLQQKISRVSKVTISTTPSTERQAEAESWQVKIQTKCFHTARVAKRKLQRLQS